MTARPRAQRLAFRSLMLTTLLTIAAGCSYLPFQRKPPPPPEVVHELVIKTPQGADMPFPQYWKGNTLIIDLRLGGGQGSAILKPREHTLWPVRLGFRVTPGQFGVLEVRAQQRAVLPVTSAGTKPVDLELDPGVFIMKSPQLALTWGPADHSSGT